MSSEDGRGPGWYRGGKPANTPLAAVCKKLCSVHCQDRSVLLQATTSAQDALSKAIRQDVLHYNTDRALHKLEGISNFDKVFPLWLFKRSKREAQEAQQRSSEPGPAHFSREDLHAFSYKDYYDFLLESFPTLMHSLAGTMMGHQGGEEIQEPYRFGFGGSHAGQKICLKSALCVAAGQALHIGHPRSFNTLQNLTSVLLSSSRVPGPLTGLTNQLGLSQSMKSGNVILDNLLKSVRDPVLRAKREIQKSHSEGRSCSGAKGRTGTSGFTVVSDNVSLESIHPKLNTGLEYQGKSLHMAQSMGYINRVRTGNMRLTPEISPAEVVAQQRYRPSTEERRQTDLWEVMAVRRSLTTSQEFRRFRNTTRPPNFPFDDLMAKQSETCMLGLTMGNPASSQGMIKTLQGLQDNVPVIGKDKDTRQWVVVWCDQNFYERADQETWTLSDETSPRGRLSGLVPLPQLWHKRQKDLILHKDTFTKAELLRTPGSLANVKEVFSLNQASRDCKDFEASWQHMELSANILLLVLAREVMAELGVTSTSATEQDFEDIVKIVHKKIQLVPKESEDEVRQDEAREDDDQLRSFFLDQASSAVRLMGQKLATQYGDGDALVTFWKLSFLDYHTSFSYKYRICTLRLIMAAEGVFGEKVRFDTRYNWGVNMKGLPGHNVEGDVHLEHYQGYFKKGAATLGGMYTEQGLRRVSDSIDVKSVALSKLYPTYQESGDITARPRAVGHRKGDWGPTVQLGAQRVGDLLTYTPGRIYVQTDKKGKPIGPYQRRRVVELSGLKKWAKVQARELTLRLSDLH